MAVVLLVLFPLLFLVSSRLALACLLVAIVLLARQSLGRAAPSRTRRPAEPEYPAGYDA